MFVSVNTLIAKNISESKYHWLDEKPFEGYNYYRIKSTSKDGKVTYSAIVSINAQMTKSSIYVYANPLVNKKIDLQFVNQISGKYFVELITSSGQKVFSKEINHAGGSRSQTISLPPDAAHGIYYLKISKPSGKVVVLKTVK